MIESPCESIGINEVKWWCYILIDINPQLTWSRDPHFLENGSGNGDDFTISNRTDARSGKASRKKIVDSPIDYSYITHESWQVN